MMRQKQLWFGRGNWLLKIINFVKWWDRNNFGLVAETGYLRLSTLSNDETETTLVWSRTLVTFTSWLASLSNDETETNVGLVLSRKLDRGYVLWFALSFVCCVGALSKGGKGTVLYIYSTSIGCPLTTMRFVNRFVGMQRPTRLDNRIYWSLRVVAMVTPFILCCLCEAIQGI